MKNLIVMRHAKSDWNNSALSDFDRPLNDRGFKSAPMMGTEFKQKNKHPDLIISSPAKRAKTTAKLFGETCGYTKDIIYNDELYFGSLDDIIKIVKELDDDINCVTIIGHNPTWESLVSMLLKESIAIQMPTAAIASIIFNIGSWQNMKTKTGELEFILIPKDVMG